MPGSYAQGTSVPVARTRGQIDELLRKWGCDGIRWTDNFTEGLIVLEFVWQRPLDGEEEPLAFMARMSLQLPSRDELRKRARHATSHMFLQSKFDKLCADLGKREMRTLHLWLKACFNAVEDGLVGPETIFLPFLVGQDGRTVAEVALPRLPSLLLGAADQLLLAGSADD